MNKTRRLVLVVMLALWILAIVVDRGVDEKFQAVGQFATIALIPLAVCLLVVIVIDCIYGRETGPRIPKDEGKEGEPD